MKKFLTAVLIVVGLLTAVVVAAIQTFDGNGRYVMSEFETEDIARQRAIQKAKENAQDKAAVYVKSFCQANGIDLTDDEISAVVHNTIIVDDVQLKQEAADINGERVVIWTATVKATIDTDSIFDFIARAEKARHND